MKICFATLEIHPTTPGGCGVLLYNAAHVLLEQGHQIIFLLDITAEAFNQFMTHDRLQFPHAERCHGYHVESLCADLPFSYADFGNRFLWQAYRFHHAAQQVAAQEQPDLLEFFDYCGVAYYALTAKISQQAYPHTQLAVRLHNSLELIDLEEPTKGHTFERQLMFDLEHHALRLAEVVLHPSESYLQQAYRPHYEPWLGHTVYSKPPLIDYPRPDSPPQQPDKVLFYGRLFGFKGVDLFVEAAVAMLDNQPPEPPTFVLVGYDSAEAPDGSPTYEAYLRRKIPARHQQQFDFKGQLPWEALAQLLPHVRFAVFPSYFESFCYAAHELYAAEIPIIVTDIPAFADYFEHEINALLFDGTVDQLRHQMERLHADPALRRRLRRPLDLTTNPLGQFYDHPRPQSWLTTPPPAAPLNMLICVLADNDHGNQQRLQQTRRSLSAALTEQTRLVICRPTAEAATAEAAAVWWLGQLYTLFDEADQPLAPSQLTTPETLLILKAGDQLLENCAYLQQSMQLLQRHPQISFVGCWHQHPDGTLDSYPLDAATEQLPQQRKILNRVVLRTPPGMLLVDLFDARLAQFGELGYLWQVEEQHGPGVVIPEPLLQPAPETPAPLNPHLLSYLVLKDNTPLRQRRLARTFVSLLLESGDTWPRYATEARLRETTAQLQAMKATKGWQFLERFWTVKARLKQWLGL